MLTLHELSAYIVKASQRPEQPQKQDQVAHFMDRLQDDYEQADEMAEFGLLFFIRSQKK